jgi:hypothetical protein
MNTGTTRTHLFISTKIAGGIQTKVSARNVKHGALVPSYTEGART